ncbi:MAG: ABC transporter ATP-binding protein [Desulfobacterales bacterium]|nr:ABC transporter ATP-binding protein [Desulfobacterales bacterium]
MMRDPALLEVKNLVKKYGKLTAVKDVSFSIRPGICFGLLGPNGAGKTTSIEVIEGIVRPTSGEILYKGRPRDGRFKHEIGIQFQRTALLAFLTVRETLKIFGSLYTKPLHPDELVALCGMEPFQHQMNDKISGGQRQRFLLALALVNNPALVFLDEPSTGLDPRARQRLWDIIREIKKNGKTVVLTTHYMEEAERLCDEIAIMDQGEIIARGRPDELIEIHCRGLTVVIPKKSGLSSLENLSTRCREVDDRIEIETDDINACLTELMSRGVDMTGLAVRSPNLESVFLNLTGKQLRGRR